MTECLCLTIIICIRDSEKTCQTVLMLLNWLAAWWPLRPISVSNFHQAVHMRD